jgi:hypothetical protein
MVHDFACSAIKLRRRSRSSSRMPANVSLAARARVTAGFAKEVEAVNH